MEEAISTTVELAFDKAFDYVQIDNLPLAPNHVKHKLKNFFRGWHVTVSAAVFLSSIVLVSNVALLIWAVCRNLNPNQTDILEIFRGNCSEMQNIFTWSHVGINILSTLLLAASNSACQVLSAPTRKEIDIAHAYGIWLDVGVPSFRNLRHIALKRLILYVLLGLSSVPLHLLYNSVIFPTTSSNDSITALVEERFIHGPAWQMRFPRGQALSMPDEKAIARSIRYLQIEASNASLITLDKKACIQQFSSQFISEYSNFLIITTTSAGLNATGAGLIQSNLKYSITHEPSESAMEWLCSFSNQYYGCYEKHVIKYPELWRMYPKKRHWKYIDRDAAGFGLWIDHCLAEAVEPRCTVSMSRSLLIAVIMCNVIKLVCLYMVVRCADDKPLVTVGDCISSFLRRPDILTRDLGALSAADVRNRLWGKGSESRANENIRPWPGKRHFWFVAAGYKRWIITITFCMVLFIPATFLSSLATADTPKGLSSGLGNLNPNMIVAFTQGWSLTSNVLFVNLPQLIISICYLFFNAVLTSSLSAAEYCGFARERKGLRVSSSIEQQRETYWLQIPYRFAIPMMVVWTALHWLVSQSIFLARINVYRYYSSDGEPSQQTRTPVEFIDGCGFSPIAVLSAVILAALMIFTLIRMGFEKYPANVPIVGTCTTAIAAACHPCLDEDEDMAYKPLMYGVLKGTTDIPEFDKARRVGFSAKEVDPLVKGELYR